jgi:hypothetical protein
MNILVLKLISVVPVDKGEGNLLEQFKQILNVDKP